MVLDDLKALLLSRLARWLELWAGFLNRQADLWASLARRSREAARTRDELAPYDADLEDLGLEKDGAPPDHWLERLRQSDLPLHWLRYQARATRPSQAVSPPEAAGLQPERRPAVPADAAEPQSGRPAEPAAKRSSAPQVQRQPGRTPDEEAEAGAPSPRVTPEGSARAPARLIPRPQPPRAQPAGMQTGGEGRQQPRARLSPQPAPEAEPTEIGTSDVTPEIGPTLQMDGEEQPETMTAAHRRQDRGVTTKAPASASSLSETMEELAVSMQAGHGSRATPPGYPAWPDLPGPPSRRGPRESHAPPAVESREIEREMQARDLVRPVDRDTGHDIEPQTWPDLGRQIERLHGPESMVPQQPPQYDSGHPQSPAVAPIWRQAGPADRWPALPEETDAGGASREALTDEEWETQLRAWERLRRLDEEQRGNPWSASPF
ncbi:MAG: hypothetical protein ACP5JG_04885 [Anaerolineae bacterium]